MKSAVISSDDNTVVNIIVADASVDAPPHGCFLVAIDDDVVCNLGHIFDPMTGGFIDPNAEEGV